MDDLISRQAAINWIINLSADIGKIQHQDLWHYEQALDEIRALLEQTAEPRKGKWEVINEKEEVYSCSECGFVAWGKAEISNYCPNCGADMRGEHDG